MDVAMSNEVGKSETEAGELWRLLDGLPLLATRIGYRPDSTPEERAFGMAVFKVAGRWAELRAELEGTDIDLDQHYCTDCKHPWSYHSEHGCSMPVTPGTNLPITRGSDVRERCGCTA